jgi:hypothetical protein
VLVSFALRTTRGTLLLLYILGLTRDQKYCSSICSDDNVDVGIDCIANNIGATKESVRIIFILTQGLKLLPIYLVVL